MPCKALPEALSGFVLNHKGTKQQNPFNYFHRRAFREKKKSRKPSRVLTPEATNILTTFLRATLDEVRLKRAAEFCKIVLWIIDSDDLDFFRTGVLRKEVTGEITFAHQRDHSAHTLYNYLLGWYIFTWSRPLRRELEIHLKDRGVGIARVEESFGALWPYVSITHDIGYIFEGTLDPLDTSSGQGRIKNAADLVHEFFHHHFWIRAGLDSVWIRDGLLQSANMAEPHFKSLSLAGVADTLRRVAKTDDILDAVKEDLDNPTDVQKDILRRRIGDAFDLWEANFDYFGRYAMKARVSAARDYFETVTSSGLKGSGLRMLDHGICSGLLIILYSTFYFGLYYWIHTKTRSNYEKLKLLPHARKSSLARKKAYQGEWWWQGIVWATAAAALHNVLQQRNEWPDGLQSRKPQRLKLSDDPLTYLGILVDMLQEWDRYNVIADSVVNGGLPLQGSDVKLGTTSGAKTRIVIVYPNDKLAKAVRQSLDKVLVGWQQIVVVKP
jgi:hypothetical protein